MFSLHLLGWQLFISLSDLMLCAMGITWTRALMTSMGLVTVEAVAAARGPAIAWSTRWGQLLGAILDNCSVETKRACLKKQYWILNSILNIECEHFIKVPLKYIFTIYCHNEQTDWNDPLQFKSMILFHVFKIIIFYYFILIKCNLFMW